MLTESNAVWQPHPSPATTPPGPPPLQPVHNYLTKNICLCNLQQNMLPDRTVHGHKRVAQLQTVAKIVASLRLTR